MKTFSAAIRTIALTTFAAASFTFAAASHALTPFSATYQFTYGNKTMGDATRKLSKQGNLWQYQFSSKIPLIGSATETSKFGFSQGQIQSVSYQRQTKILVHNDVVSMNFKPQQKQIQTSRKGTSRVLTWQNGVLDDLNAELQVREDLKQSGLKSSYLIADYKEVEARQFVKEGSEKIKAADGKSYDTVKIRLKHDRANKNTIFWLAPSLDYLPVKVTHQDGDQSYGLLLKAL
ncbi:MAG: DUF3108 domain-containing protein [Acinetobacter populi]|jgi:hypothetical protein|uniref:DUF3108 domain-containing protein n=1 Tax=Acinetobacter populi TaxID=1582270 RepID=UPI002354C9D7|nr:DUF3108 domain-containing protein [Acinetobacter populi]MCH4249223.1 DUF3108 domain-containing protein [Acinetobacter populi]